MSTPNTVFVHEKNTAGSLGEDAGLSKSNTTNLSKCYPNSPIHQSSPVITIDGTSVTLSETNSSLDYKRLYYKTCMRGESEADSFGTQDMSYGTSNLVGYSSKPPKYDDIWPEGEAANAGFNGSSISKSGLGPNVSSSSPEVIADVKPDAQQPNPFNSSDTMTPLSTEIPAKFDIGSSFASSVGDTIGNINDGQSSSVAS